MWKRPLTALDLKEGGSWACFATHRGGITESASSCDVLEGEACLQAPASSEHSSAASHVHAAR
eukprot:COSAG01_NODE_6132_length_3775_cov_3.629183_3_plen_63_part_00